MSLQKYILCSNASENRAAEGSSVLSSSYREEVYQTTAITDTEITMKRNPAFHSDHPVYIASDGAGTHVEVLPHYGL